MQLTNKQQKWLKILHLLFVILWVGAAIVLNLGGLFLENPNPTIQWGILMTLKFIDDFVIIPSAIGILFTGIIYSCFTSWGWFKHRWIVVKWVITIYGILFGTFVLGPSLNEQPILVKNLAQQFIFDSDYISNKKVLNIFGTSQVMTLIFASIISTLKPWRKKSKN